MNVMTLRPYQRTASHEVRVMWHQGVTRPAVVLPTGTGKTVIFSVMCAEDAASGSRPLILVHREELIGQTVHKLTSVAPGLEPGIVRGPDDYTGDVTVASVATLSRSNRLARHAPDAFDFIVVDEAHHAAAPSYVRILDHFGVTERRTRAVGFSATLERDDGTLGTVWDAVAFRMDILPAIASGHLVDPTGIRVSVPGMDMGTVGKARGDYSDSGIATALSENDAGRVIATAYARHAQLEPGRPPRKGSTLRPGIVFGPTVAAAESIATDLNAAGIRTAVVVGETPQDSRDMIYAQIKTGDLDVISSVMVLTEGFDLPEIEVAVIARPTQSHSLYVQMVGRVLRPAPWVGKRTALVLDVVGASAEHELCVLADLTGVDLPDGASLTQGTPKDPDDATAPALAGGSGFTGDLDAHAVDLFEGSANAWLTTKAGVWFIPTKEVYVFLWPETPHLRSGADLWRVGVTPHNRTGGEYKIKALTIDMAMAWAESIATDLDPSISRRKAPWRRKPTSPKMMEFAARLGIDAAGLRAGAVSDAITRELASRKFDRAVTG